LGSSSTQAVGASLGLEVIPAQSLNSQAVLCQ
jgi:hypothetical protein